MFFISCFTNWFINDLHHQLTWQLSADGERTCLYDQKITYLFFIVLWCIVQLFIYTSGVFPVEDAGGAGRQTGGEREAFDARNVLKVGGKLHLNTCTNTTVIHKWHNATTIHKLLYVLDDQLIKCFKKANGQIYFIYRPEEKHIKGTISNFKLVMKQPGINACQMAMMHQVATTPYAGYFGKCGLATACCKHIVGIWHLQDWSYWMFLLLFIDNVILT